MRIRSTLCQVRVGQVSGDDRQRAGTGLSLAAGQGQAQARPALCHRRTWRVQGRQGRRAAPRRPQVGREPVCAVPGRPRPIGEAGGCQTRVCRLLTSMVGAPSPEDALSEACLEALGYQRGPVGQTDGEGEENARQGRTREFVRRYLPYEAPDHTRGGGAEGAGQARVGSMRSM